MRLRCIIPGCNGLREANGKNYLGKRSFKQYCSRHRKNRAVPNIDKSKCSKCGFIPDHPCQIDIDHIDGDKRNNSLSNLQALCANCHRLKTLENRDWVMIPTPVELDRCRQKLLPFWVGDGTR